MVDYSELFDNGPDRRGTMSYKWDTTAEGVTPMWVADMDFRTAPCIIDALRRRVDHGIFGYTAVPDSYYRAVDNWFGQRHQWHISRDSVIYTSGVVPAVSAIIKAMTKPGDKVITQTPAYNCFFSSIRNNGCELADNPLIYNAADGSYAIDFDNLESLASDPRAKVLILCNPHNPSGRVWTRDELRRIADICLKHNVFVIADEIHCELVYEPNQYVPYASLGADVARNCAACVSPSKAFNIAGLQIANIVAADDSVRARIDRAINDNEVCDVNPFGPTATIAAYYEGGEWLDALVGYLHDNFALVRETFERLGLVVTPLQATYLAWINVRPLGMTGAQVADLLEQEAKVRLNAGDMYGSEGADFIRLNFACPRSRLTDALARIASILK